MPRVPAATALRVALASLAVSGGSVPVARADEVAPESKSAQTTVQTTVARTVSARTGYRLHFPGDEPPGERAARLPTRRSDTDGSGLAAVPMLSFGARLLLWALGAAGAIFLGIALYRAWRQRGADEERPAGGVGDEMAGTASGARGRSVGFEDADALAARGDLAGAMHALLRAALRRLHGQTEPPPAWTARTALVRLPLDADRRARLRILVEAVERTRYAGVAPDPETYARCRAASEAL